jgi:protein O-mannosyl-transferase
VPGAGGFGLREKATAGLLFVATLIVYLPALNGTFVWDDSAYVTEPSMRSLHGLWRIWFDLRATAFKQYYPLLHSAFWAEHRFWGDAVFGYHLLNVILHAAAALMVFLIARKLTLPGAWLAGFLFALHPVAVESVAQIAEEKNTLSAVLYLGSALAYLHFDQTRRRRQYLFALALFLLALTAKTVTATLPAALLAIFWWRRGRLSWKGDWLPLLPWLALGASAGLFTAWVERNIVGAQGPDYALSLLQRFLLAGRVIWFYAGKIVWPADLVFTYPRWNIDPSDWRQYLFPLGALALAAALWLAARGTGLLAFPRLFQNPVRGPLAAFLFFVGTLFPVLGFFNVEPFVYSYVADHFQYLASLGIIVPAAAGLTLAAERQQKFRRFAPILAGLLLATLGALTWRQSGYYRNAAALHRQTLEHNPAAWIAHNNLGIELAKIPGRLPDAIAEYQEALRYRPNLELAHYNLGRAYAQIPGRLPDAVVEYQEALRIRPNYEEARYDLGNALSRIPGQQSGAIAQYRAALQIKSDDAEAHYNLANVLAGIPGRLPDAIAEYQAALRYKPDDAQAHNNLANALSKIPGRLPDAIAEYQVALRLKPDFAEAHGNLGVALAHIPSRLPDAIAEYQAALQLRPGDADAHNNLGIALSQTPGRSAEALAEFQAAAQIRPDFAEAHFNLGNALSEIPGRRQDAIAEYQAALRIRPDLEPAREMLQKLMAER